MTPVKMPALRPWSCCTPNSILRCRSTKLSSRFERPPGPDSPKLSSVLPMLAVSDRHHFCSHLRSLRTTRSRCRPRRICRIEDHRKRDRRGKAPGRRRSGPVNYAATPKTPGTGEMQSGSQRVAQLDANARFRACLIDAPCSNIAKFTSNRSHSGSPTALWKKAVNFIYDSKNADSVELIAEFR